MYICIYAYMHICIYVYRYICKYEEGSFRVYFVPTFKGLGAWFPFSLCFLFISVCLVQCSFISFDFLSCPFCSMHFLLLLFMSCQFISFHFLSFSLVAVDFLRLPSFSMNLLFSCISLHLACFFCLLLWFEID